MSESLETGLRLRLRRALRRMEVQHERLRPLVRELDDAIRTASDAVFTERLGLLIDALRAHFELEEAVVFPALHGLSPPAQRALAQLAAEHASFVSQLREMLRGVASVRRDSFHAFREALGEHERREEDLLESVVAPGDLTDA